MRKHCSVCALVVDTGCRVCERVGHVLHDVGGRVLRAASPAEAVATAGARRPDVVLINLALPRRIGNYALSWLRLEEGTASIPVVLLVDQGRWGRRGTDAAGDVVVPRPWSAERVAAAMRRLLRSRDRGARSPGNVWVTP